MPDQHFYPYVINVGTLGDSQAEAYSPSLTGNSQGLSQSAIAGDHAVFVFAAGRLSPEFPASGFEDQTASSYIPEANAAFDVGIKAAGRDIGQGEGGGAHDSDFADAMHQLIEIRQR